ncbi:unnamed protein product [Alopecurus aequalis]
MKKGASSKAAKTAMAETEEQQVERVVAELAFLRATMTEEQQAARQAAQLAFLKPALEEYQRYIAMKKEDVVEEYRRAGKLHTYDHDKELQKRFARIANLYPCWWPDHMVQRIKEYTKYLEEDEDDYKIGLYSLIEG